MRRLTLAWVVLLALPLSALAKSHGEVIPLWKDGAPGFENRKDIPERAQDYWVRDVNYPSLTVFRPGQKANGCAVVIAPGGGFRELVFNAEGRQPAEFLNRLGITAFALKYRLPKAEGSPYTLGNVRQDAYRAIRLVRSRAKEFAIDPDRVGILGFSAGGAVVMMVAFDKGDGDPTAADPVDRLNGRPNFEMLVYPGGDVMPHVVPPDTGAAFMVAADDDEYGCDQTMLDLAAKFRSAKVPVEVHLFAQGKHAFNMGNRSQFLAVRHWPDRMAEWLKDRGLAP